MLHVEEFSSDAGGIYHDELEARRLQRPGQLGHARSESGTSSFTASLQCDLQAWRHDDLGRGPNQVQESARLRRLLGLQSRSGRLKYGVDSFDELGGLGDLWKACQSRAMDFLSCQKIKIVKID